MVTAKNNPMFRPPAEAGSLILQVDEGCPHNRCAFCGMYKTLRYRARSLPEIHALIEREARHDPATRRVFLADGDVMRRPAQELEAILRDLAEHLPALARVNAYACSRGIREKSDDELRRLRSLKMHTLYLGLESGDEATLARMHKGETASEMIEAAHRAQECGLHLSVMVLLGLGGVEGSRAHATATAMALNHMQPRLLSVLRVIPVPGTALEAEVRKGSFKPLSEYHAVEELRQLVDGLELTNTVFRANHSSNIIPLEARFPRDKERLLEELDTLLHSGELDARTPGPQPFWL